MSGLDETYYGANKKVWRWALFGLCFSLALTLGKWCTYRITSSVAVQSDAIESIVNVLSSSFVLYAIWLSNKPRDDEHPYGHGKVEYFSAGFEGALVLFAALSIAAVGVYRCIEPVPVREVGLGMILQGAISATTWLAGVLMMRAGEVHNSPSLHADGVHIRSDALTSFGVLVGMALTWWSGWLWMDAAVAIAVAIWLFVSGVLVVRDAIGGLMDEADPDLLARVATCLEEQRAPGWIAPHHTKIHRLGRALHIDIHMVFPAYWTIEHIHEGSKRMDTRLAKEFGADTEVMLHMESCTPKSCTYCDVEHCPIRQFEFVQRNTWTAAFISQRHRPGPVVLA